MLCSVRVILLAALIAGGAHADPVPPPPADPWENYGAKEPPKRWYKEGASREEFERATGYCDMKKWETGDLNPFIFRPCMRSLGWQLR